MRMRYRTGVQGAGVGGKIVGTLAGLFFGSIGLFLMVMALGEARQYLRKQAWTPTPCTIVAAEVADAGDEYQFSVQYRYAYGGRDYTGDRYGSHAQYAFEGVALRRSLLERYPVGKEATCYVDPNSPSDAVLVRDGSLWGPLGGALFCSVFVLIGYGIVYGIWRTKSGTAAVTEAEPKALTRQPGQTAVGLFCGLFIAIGVIVPWFTFVKPLQRQWAAQQWKPVEAVVEKSLVKSHRGDDSTTYSVYIAYRYTFDGKAYEGDRYRFLSGSSSGHESKAAIVRQHPKGSKLTVYVDPANPQESVILRDAGASLYLGLIPLVFAVFGGLFLFAFRKGMATGGYRPHKLVATGASDHPNRTAASQTFKRASTPAGRLIGLLLVALFWNGIVSVFVFHVVQEWKQGRRPIFLTLFLVPFLLVGAGIIVGFFREILRLFNPRVELDPPSTLLAPGVTARVRFRVVGNVRRISKLTVTLTGQEEATYQRGTTTQTDKHEFLKAVLFETADPRRMELGDVELALPEGTMHSFKSSHNKIVWTLTVRGAIARWPDVSEAFILDVLPKEIRT